MSESILIWCGSTRLPKGLKDDYKRVVKLDTYPDKGNVFLSIENISTKLAQELPSLALDMLEIGSYVYCADQTITRGGKTFPNDGAKWRRHFTFEIPVRNLKVWEEEKAKELLIESLSFLSDDYYEFNFRQLDIEIPTESYFDFEKGQTWFDADEILLFSGGLDSLAGSLEEILQENKKVVLVSHRPVAKISKRQKDLVTELGKLAKLDGKFLHIPIWVNKDKELTKDTNQRTRSFLFTMLASSIAMIFNINKIKFYENGIVSTNLPISEQLVGARASRSTHPKSLFNFSKLLSQILNKEFAVTNPFYWKTKSDVIEVFKKHKFADLIKYSNSCSHVRTTNKTYTHCGVCSQCVERRIATLYHNIGENDPEEMYKTQLFTDTIKKSEDKVMVESYIKHAQLLESIDEDRFFQRFGEVNRITTRFNIKTSEAAEKILKLHKRHGQQCQKVIENQIIENADIISRKKLNHYSLLQMIVNQPNAGKKEIPLSHKFPTPENTKWEDISIEIRSSDSIRVRINSIVRTYSALDIGFRDRRKGDLPTKQWDLLVSFAESNGVLYWGSQNPKEMAQKDIQKMKKILCNFFQLNESPIKRYDPKIGYVTRFKILDKSYGKG